MWITLFQDWRQKDCQTHGHSGIGNHPPTQLQSGNSRDRRQGRSDGIYPTETHDTEQIEKDGGCYQMLTVENTDLIRVEVISNLQVRVK